jgi:hypothetical protein
MPNYDKSYVELFKITPAESETTEKFLEWVQ